MKISFAVESFPLAICFEAHTSLPLVSALSFLEGKPEFNSSRSLSPVPVGGRVLAFKKRCKALTQRNSGGVCVGGGGRGSIPVSQTGILITVRELCCCPQTLTIATDLVPYSPRSMDPQVIRVKADLSTWAFESTIPSSTR